MEPLLVQSSSKKVESVTESFFSDGYWDARFQSSDYAQFVPLNSLESSPIGKNLVLYSKACIHKNQRENNIRMTFFCTIFLTFPVLFSRKNRLEKSTGKFDF